jgi:hypothetical protein
MLSSPQSVMAQGEAASLKACKAIFVANIACGLFTGGLDRCLPNALRIACAFANTFHGRSARNVYEGLQRAFTHVVAIGVSRRMPSAVQDNAELSKLLELVAMGYKHSRFEDMKAQKKGGQSRGGGGVLCQIASHEEVGGVGGAHAPEAAHLATARPHLNAAGLLTDAWEQDVLLLLGKPLVANALLELQVCASCCRLNRVQHAVHPLLLALVVSLQGYTLWASSPLCVPLIPHKQF